VSLLPQTVGSPPQARRESARAGAKAQWLILGLYLLAAVTVTWRLWADPASRAQGTGDIDQFAWFMRYSATAISHGHLPALVTTAMNAPYGVNLMWNTSFLLPGILLTPVTLLAGPQVSLTLLLTAGFAGSAAALFGVLRRWGASATAAAVGGAVYGFSPALVHAGSGGYQLQFMVLPPLIIDAVLRIITGRGSAARTGVWLGLLAAAQVFIAEEILVGTAVVAAVMTAVVAASRPRTALRQAGGACTGLAIAAGVTLLICGRALWVQLRGPAVSVGGFWTDLPAFVTPSRDLLFHTSASADAIAGTPAQGAYLAYLGWPLIITLAAVVIFFWRHQRVRIAAITFVVLELFSLGSHVLVLNRVHYAGPLLPWYWLQGLPLLSAVLPYRLCILAAGAAGALLAFSLDLALIPAGKKNMPNAGWGVLAAVILATVPLIPRPYQAVRVAPLPAGWQAVFTRLNLAPGARVLVVPVPYALIPQPLRWQADTGEPGSMIGGDFIAFNSRGRVARAGQLGQTRTATYLNGLWAGSAPARAPSPARVRADFAAWRPAAIVAVTGRDSPLARFLSDRFGPPTCEIGSVVAWRPGAGGQQVTAG
jgi:hypothetical protein